jgi:transcriptional regulator with XRE-family HTH domain
VDDQRVGSVLRTVRRRRRLTQQQLAEAAGTSQTTVSRLERGHMQALSLSAIRRVAGVLEVRLELVPRWRGADLGRLLDATHADLVEIVLQRLRSAGWATVPEATFSVFGERGAIDVLAWHAARRSLLVIEVKSTIAEIHDLLAGVDRKRRLAHGIVRERGWRPDHVSVWLVIRDDRTNRRRLARYRSSLRAAFPSDGRAVRAWLIKPAAPIAALSFLPHGHPRHR